MDEAAGLADRSGNIEIHADRERLPWAALLALAMTGFTAILTETLPAGLLPMLANGFAVSQAAAGQLVTSYAAGSLLAAIPMTAAAQRWRRKPTLLAAIAGFVVFNSTTALSTRFDVALVARFLAGVAAGLAWGLLAGYARRMVAPSLQGRALAVAMVGTPVALSLGVPAGTFLGASIGWRAAFCLLSASTLVLVAWVLAVVPDYPGQALGERRSVGAVLRMPGVRPVLAVIFAWMTAHNILYTFVAPLAARAGLASRVDLLLLGFGLAALAGIWAVGLTVDRWLRRLVLASLALFGAVALMLGVAGQVPAVLVATMLLWGLSFGGAATLVQTAIGDEAGEGVDLASAMVTTVWNGAIAVGGVVGGILFERFGAASFAWAALVFILAALAIAARASNHGFRPGRRSHAQHGRKRDMITTIDGGAAVHGAADEEFPVPDGFEGGARDIDGVRLHTVAGGSGPLVLPPSYAGQDVAAPLHGLAKSVSPAARFDLVAHDIGIWTTNRAAAAHGGDVRKIVSMAAPSDASGREVTA